jgi:Ulp1 family protease
VVSIVLLWVKPQSLQKCLNLTRLSLNRLQRAVVDRHASDLHIFSSHFFTTLSDDGTDAVRSWTAKKNIDIFQKKLIFIPINQSLHWSLCVVVNPGAIVNASSDEGSSDDPLACMIFLDSLKAHRKGWVRTQVMKWLNAEWRRLEKEEDGTHTGNRFTNKTFPILDPVGKFARFDAVSSSVMQLAY